MEKSGEIRIALTGDSIAMRPISVHTDPPSRGLRELIWDCDVAFTNLEVLPNDFQGYPALDAGGTHLATRARVLDDLMLMGFDLFACANNHSLDYSIEGLLRTIEVLEEARASYAGIGRNLGEARLPVYVERPGGTIALLACASSFARGQEAAEARPDLPGRPGLNPLRFDTVYEVTPEQMRALRAMAEELGLEEQRQQRIQLGFAFPPDDPSIFQFLDASFREAERAAVITTPKGQDIEALARWTREARARADVVIVSLHAHEQGATKEEPADFIVAFARRMIDEGADLVVGHGPHLLRGLEVYRGKPIFYSLGNFVGQNELVERLPADSYERFRADPGLTPSQVFRQRNQNDARGFPSDVRYWQTVMPILRYEGGAPGTPREIELVPVSLGLGEPSYRRGRPRLAEGREAAEILARFAALSEPFGTRLDARDGRASVRLEG